MSIWKTCLSHLSISLTPHRSWIEGSSKDLFTNPVVGTALKNTDKHGRVYPKMFLNAEMFVDLFFSRPNHSTWTCIPLFEVYFCGPVPYAQHPDQVFPYKKIGHVKFSTALFEGVRQDMPRPCAKTYSSLGSFEKGENGTGSCRLRYSTSLRFIALGRNMYNLTLLGVEPVTN